MTTYYDQGECDPVDLIYDPPRAEEAERLGITDDELYEREGNVRGPDGRWMRPEKEMGE